MAFQQFGRPKAQVPADPRMEQDENEVQDMDDMPQEGAEMPPERPVAPGDTGALDVGDELTEASEPTFVQQIEDILGVEIPEELWERVNALAGKRKDMPLSEKQVENKASVFQRFGGSKG
jgi:hypothetical protein